MEIRLTASSVCQRDSRTLESISRLIIFWRMFVVYTAESFNLFCLCVSLKSKQTCRTEHRQNFYKWISRKIFGKGCFVYCTADFSSFWKCKFSLTRNIWLFVLSFRCEKFESSLEKEMGCWKKWEISVLYDFRISLRENFSGKWNEIKILYLDWVSSLCEKIILLKEKRKYI